MNFQSFASQESLEPVGYLTALSRLIVDGTVSRRNPKPAANHPVARMTRLSWRPNGIHTDHGRSELAFIYLDPTADVPSSARTLIFHSTIGIEFAISRGGLSLPIPNDAYIRAGLAPPERQMEFALSREDRNAEDWCTTILNPR